MFPGDIPGTVPMQKHLLYVGLQQPKSHVPTCLVQQRWQNYLMLHKSNNSAQSLQENGKPFRPLFRPLMLYVYSYISGLLVLLITEIQLFSQCNLNNCKYQPAVLWSNLVFILVGVDGSSIGGNFQTAKPRDTYFWETEIFFSTQKMPDCFK